MAAFGIQGQMLAVTVVRCIRLKDTEWRISRQDPYVCIEYGSTKVRTRTCTDGGTNPVYEEKFMFNLIEGLRELNINVWNSNTLSSDDFIGSGKVPLHKVLSQGFDDASWTIVDRKERFSGEVKLMLQYTHATERSMASNGNSASPAVAPPPGTTTPYPYPMSTTYYPAPSPYLSSYPPNGIAAYSSSPYHPTTLQAAYPPQPYPPPTQTYPPPTQTYPSQTYPRPTQIYPPPPPGYPQTYQQVPHPVIYQPWPY